MSNIISGRRYENASEAIGWLCKAFGFQRQLVVAGMGGTIAHAQLTFGDGMVMLGSASDDEHDQHFKLPVEIGGYSTQSAYIVVKDIDAHYEGAKAAGAEMLMDLKEQEYGGKLCTCRDSEGHIWSFGSYDPWDEAGK